MLDYLELEARGSKQSQDVTEGLAKAYAQLERGDKEAINGVLSEWLLSDSLTRRYDSRSLVRQFKITSAMPALIELSERLRRDSSIRARKELELILDVITEVAAAPLEPIN